MLDTANQRLLLVLEEKEQNLQVNLQTKDNEKKLKIRTQVVLVSQASTVIITEETANTYPNLLSPFST